jgi:hypothetical protein
VTNVDRANPRPHFTALSNAQHLNLTISVAKNSGEEKLKIRTNSLTFRKFGEILKILYGSIFSDIGQ